MEKKFIDLTDKNEPSLKDVCEILNYIAITVEEILTKLENLEQ